MNDTATSSRRPRFSRGKIAAAAVVVIALAGFGIYKVKTAGAGESEYIFASVHTGDIEDLVTATGVLEPRDKVDVGAQVSGQIERILVEVGDTVTAGQVLAEIDATTARARVEANRASLEAQRSNLIDRQNSLAKAERDYQRQVNLKKDDATTEEALLNAETTLKSARQAITSLEAQIKQQQASMRVEEANLQYTTIKAPITGTVVSIPAKQGQTINATQTSPTLMTVADLATMTVRAEVSEADIGKLSQGMQAYFTTLGSQNRRYYGTLKRKEPTPKTQNSVVLYYALFDVQNDSLELMPSMTAQVFFVRAEARNVLVVPMAALQQGQQIARERMMKEREAGGAAAGPGGAPGNLMGRGDGAGGNAPAGAGANAPAGEAGAAPGAGVPAGEGAAGAVPAAGAGNEVAANGNGNQRGDGSQRGEGRQGQGGGNRQGGFGNFNGGQPPTPEQMEQFRRMREQRMAGGGGGMPGGMGGAMGGMGGFRPGGMQGGQNQRRNGIVMVKKADGTLEERRVVVGVSNRTHGQVLEGLAENDEVVVGVEQNEAEAAPATGQQNQQNNNFRPGNFGGGGGGGFRPF